MTRPSRRAILKRTAPIGVSTATISRCRHSRSTSECRRPMVVVSRKMTVRNLGEPLGSRDHGQQRARPILLHLHRHVEHFERACSVQPVHDDAEDLRVHVVDFALDDDHAFGRAGGGRRSNQHAQHVRRCRIVAFAGAVADLLDAHCGNRTERLGVRRDDQRAGRRDQLFLHRSRRKPVRRRAASRSPAPARETGRAPSAPCRRPR